MGRQPLLSLIIPTRERAETLSYTLRTALADPYPDVEIIVSDNASQDETPSVVKRHDDIRLRYINPGNRLAMTQHFEFALAHASGEYACIIGDDDAVNRGGITALAAHIDHSRHLDAYTWPTHVYIWPHGTAPARIAQLWPRGLIGSDLDLHAMVRKAIRWGIFNYAPLPHLYHSAVRVDVMNQVRARTGSYFKTTSPDVYTSFVLPAFAKTARNIAIPITTNGHSPKSNSGAVIGLGDKELVRHLAEQGSYAMHRDIPASIDRMVAVMLDPMLVAMDTIPEHYADVRPNFSALWAFAESVMGEKTGFRVLSHWPSLKGKISISAYGFYASVHRVNKFRTRLRHRAMELLAPPDIATFADMHPASV